MVDETKRILGIFWAQLCGDALGSRYEFLSLEKVKQLIQNDMIDDHLPMRGGGKFRKHAGQITDDSEMALSLAHSLIKCKGFNQADVATSYARWLSTKPPDVGLTTSCALSMPALLVEEKEVELTEDRKNRILKYCLSQTKEFNSRSLSNGCLMRISLLSIAMRNADENDLIKAAELDCKITHQNPIAIQATQFFVMLLVNLLKGQQPSEAIENAKKLVKSQLLLDIIAESKEAATPVRLENGTKVKGDQEFMGYLGVALQKSMIKVMEIGGDTDTNGCISAVLLGAHLGLDAIPKDWIETVQNAPIDRDYFFMEPLKNKSVDEFVDELANSCCHLYEPPSYYSSLQQCSIL